MAACGISGIEPLDSKMDLMEVNCENGRLIELAQGHV